MKWDIDRALAALENSGAAGTTLSRVDLMGADVMERALGKITDDERAREGILVWCIALGALRGPKQPVLLEVLRGELADDFARFQVGGSNGAPIDHLRAPTKKPRKRKA